MSKKELLSSYKTSLNFSLVSMTVSCMGLLGLLVFNNQEAIRLFFYQPLLFAAISGALSFVAVPLIALLLSFLKSKKTYSAA